MRVQELLAPADITFDRIIFDDSVVVESMILMNQYLEKEVSSYSISEGIIFINTVMDEVIEEEEKETEVE